MLFLADLHIHTALSPCAEAEMTPPAIVEAAIRKGLAMIAICDHNAAGNVAAVWSAGLSPYPSQIRPEGRTPYQSRLAVIAGMEITTVEEVHVVGLFPGPWAALAAAEEVRATLPPATEKSSRFGEQRLLDAAGGVRGREERMLSAASAFELSAAVDLIHRRNGLAIASHIDRPAFGVIGQLGLFPTDAGFDAIELSGAWWRRESRRAASRAASEGAGAAAGTDFGVCKLRNDPPSALDPLDRALAAGVAAGTEFGVYKLRNAPAGSADPLDRALATGLPLLCGSDSHSLSDIGACRTAFELQEPTFEELALALRGLGGRRCHRA